MAVAPAKREAPSQRPPVPTRDILPPLPRHGLSKDPLPTDGVVPSGLMLDWVARVALLPENFHVQIRHSWKAQAGRRDEDGLGQAAPLRDRAAGSGVGMEGIRALPSHCVRHATEEHLFGPAEPLGRIDSSL